MLCPHFVGFINLKKKIFQWTLYLCNLFRHNKKLEPYLQNTVIVNLLLKMLPLICSSNSKGMGNASSFLLWNICLFSTREVKKDHLQYMASAEISLPGWISPNFNPWSPHHWVPIKRIGRSIRGEPVEKSMVPLSRKQTSIWSKKRWQRFSNNKPKSRICGSSFSSGCFQVILNPCHKYQRTCKKWLKGFHGLDGFQWRIFFEKNAKKTFSKSSNFLSVYLSGQTGFSISRYFYLYSQNVIGFFSKRC